MSMRCTPPSRFAVVTTIPPSATATPMSVTVPCVVVACSSTIDLAAVWAAAGTPFRLLVRVVSVAPPGALRAEPLRGDWEAGESRMTRKAPTAATAAAAMKTMRRPR